MSTGVCQIVEKALAKLPEARYANAGALLRDLERLLRGEPVSMALHPQPPACDPDKVLRYQFVWELNASPQQLWPYVSNTERLNRAAGLPAVQFTSAEGGEGAWGQDPDTTSPPQHLPARPRRFGRFRKAGITVAWEEYPFEWVEMRRMGGLREYSQGPFHWLVSVTDLRPRAGGGTTLTHEVRLEPRGLLGRAAAAVEVGVKGRRALDRVYRRIDALLTDRSSRPALADPFEAPAALGPARRRRLHRLLDRLVKAGVDPAVVDQVGRFLAEAPAQEVARIRPLALARRLALDPQPVVAACLHGAREGLLVLLWDILCPVCRVPSQVQDTLRALREHGHCEACNLEFELDFARSVEMIFRAHPEIRTTDLGTYCVGGPAHSPHVAAQVRVGPGERVELELTLPEGDYRLRGPQLPFALDFRVRPGVAVHRWDLTLSRGAAAGRPHTFGAGGQVLALTNDYDCDVVVRLERTAPREDVLTAARASTLPLFRELFPEEVLAAGQLVSVATVAFLVTALDRANHLYEELGDARAFGLIHEHFRLLDEGIRRGGGALVKTVGEGVVAVFSETTAAVRVGLGLQALLAREEATRGLRLRVAVHCGPALAATLNDHLDYFGTTVSQAMQLPQWARGGELILTPVVAAEPGVSALLRKRGVQGELVPVNLPGLTGEPLQRLVLPDAGPNGLPEAVLIPG